MKMETKSAALLIATLALGVILGMVGQGLLMRERTQRAGELQRPPGFVAHMERVIAPTPAQRDTVRALLEQVASRNDSIIGSARGDLRSALDALQRQLAPLLTSHQRDRLARMSQLPDPFRPPPPRNGGPPDGRGPPPEGRGPPPGNGHPPPSD